jgi:hypothetical protein
MTMKNGRLVRVLMPLTLCAGVSVGVAQAPAAGPTAASQLGPAISALKQAVQQMTVDKWKLPKPVHDTTATNLNSIRKDVQETLPGLMGAADAAPSSVAAMLPVSRNLAALYDVVLRVAVVADAAAPQDQVQAIEAAMGTLDDARRGYADRLQTAADAQERHVVAMQKTLSAPPAPAPAAVAPVCPAPAPVPAKKKPVKKPVPATTPPPS